MRYRGKKSPVYGDDIPWMCCAGERSVACRAATLRAESSRKSNGVEQLRFNSPPMGSGGPSKWCLAEVKSTWRQPPPPSYLYGKNIVCTPVTIYTVLPEKTRLFHPGDIAESKHRFPWTVNLKDRISEMVSSSFCRNSERSDGGLRHTASNLMCASNLTLTERDLFFLTKVDAAEKYKR